MVAMVGRMSQNNRQLNLVGIKNFNYTPSPYERVQTAIMEGASLQKLYLSIQQLTYADFMAVRKQNQTPGAFLQELNNRQNEARLSLDNTRNCLQAINNQMRARGTPTKEESQLQLQLLQRYHQLINTTGGFGLLAYRFVAIFGLPPEN